MKVFRFGIGEKIVHDTSRTFVLPTTLNGDTRIELYYVDPIRERFVFRSDETPQCGDLIEVHVPPFMTLTASAVYQIERIEPCLHCHYTGIMRAAMENGSFTSEIEAALSGK